MKKKFLFLVFLTVAVIAAAAERPPLYTIQTIAAPFKLTGAAAGDLNGDGVPDLILCGGKAGAAIFLSQKDGGFPKTPDRTFSEPYFNAAIFDFDGDGENDFILNGWQHYITFFYAADRFAKPVPHYHWGECHQTPAVFRNADGTCDIFTASGVRRIQKDGGIRRGFVMPDKGETRSMFSPCISDLDSDGNPDYVFRTDKFLYLYYGPLPNAGFNSHMPPSGFSKVEKIPLDSAFGAPVVFDCDADGLPEILIGSASRDKTLVLASDHFGEFRSGKWKTLYPFGCRYVVADFNGDGKSELAVIDKKSCRFLRSGESNPFLTVPLQTGGDVLEAVAAGCDGGKRSVLVVCGPDQVNLIKLL